MSASRRLAVEDIGPALEAAFSDDAMPTSQDIKHAIVTQELKAFVIEQDKLTEDRVMARLTRLLLGQLMIIAAPVCYGIWLLSGIYSTGAQSLDIVKQQQVELAKRGEWMQERQRWEDRVEMWAVPKGFTPPRYRTGKVEQ